MIVMRKIKHTYMSVLAPSADMEISSKEQILHLDSSRSVRGSPAKHQICSSMFLDSKPRLALLLLLFRASIFKNLFPSVFTQIPFLYGFT